MADLNQLQAELRAAPKMWLITGVAGFIRLIGARLSRGGGEGA